jgi:hypothetical protein
MTGSRIIVVVCALVLVVGSTVRAVMLLPYPVGSGQSVKSPDGQYEFYAGNMTDKTFWGGTRQYYRFEVRDLRQNRTIRSWELAPPRGEAPVPYYGPTVITWSPNSASVVLPIAGGLDLKLSL